MIKELAKQWLEAKEQERKDINTRREVEDQILKALSIPDNFDSSAIINEEGYKLKLTGRLTHKIDSDKLQEIAIENGLMDELSTLFRWKPDINLKAWENTDENITRPLLGAITTKPGRVSFSITEEN